MLLKIVQKFCILKLPPYNLLKSFILRVFIYPISVFKIPQSNRDSYLLYKGLAYHPPFIADVISIFAKEVVQPLRHIADTFVPAVVFYHACTIFICWSVHFTLYDNFLYKVFKQVVSRKFKTIPKQRRRGQ